MEIRVVERSFLKTRISIIFKDVERDFDSKIYELGKTSLVFEKDNIKHVIIGGGDINPFSKSLEHSLHAIQNNSYRFPEEVFKSLKEAIKFYDIDAFAIKLDELQVRCFIENMHDTFYFFDDFKTNKHVSVLQEIEIESHTESDDVIIAQAISGGRRYAKDLVYMPANVCTTDYLLEQAKKLSQMHASCSFEYLDERQMEKEGMNCFLAVGRASKQPSYLALLTYSNGPRDQSPIVFVGKGLVFDSGGLNIKTGNHMYGMHGDMAGVASLYGMLASIMELDLKINVVIAACLVENSTGSDSYRPGDVLVSHHGMSVEVVNTDAEGRLVLCDALSYVKKYDPSEIVDVCTLTGSIWSALGSAYSGLFSNDEKISRDLIRASIESQDHVWPMPLAVPYTCSLTSDVADTSHLGNMSVAGSISAALFLQKFVQGYKWAHLDIAGSAGSFSKSTKPSGRVVPLLTQYLINKVFY